MVSRSGVYYSWPVVVLVALGSLNTYKNALSVAERTFFRKRPVV